eukprot:GILK01019967.1.p1 GENE.GILK01019967.1~~GILK01019967.1.p1  ORF type:complete len:135 (-),score=4.35 GILK01019967.1:212-616(-)
MNLVNMERKERKNPIKLIYILQQLIPRHHRLDIIIIIIITQTFNSYFISYHIQGNQMDIRLVCWEKKLPLFPQTKISRFVSLIPPNSNMSQNTTNDFFGSEKNIPRPPSTKYKFSQHIPHKKKPSMYSVQFLYQ